MIWISANYPGFKNPYFGLISNIFFSRITFSKASSSVGSPGSAHGSTSIWLSEGNLKFQFRSVPPTF